MRGEPAAHFTHTKTKARTVTLPAIASAYVRTRPVWSIGQLAPDPARARGDGVDRAEQDRALDPVTERDRQGHARLVEDPVVELVEVELVLEQSAHRPGPRDRERPGRVGRPRDCNPGDAHRDGNHACDELLGAARLDERLGDRIEEVGDRGPELGDLDPASDRGQHGENPDRPGHPDPRLGSLGPVEVLSRPRGRLAAEDEEDHPERVEAGQERTSDSDGEQQLSVPAGVERGGEDRVLREEPGQRRDPGQRERTDEEGPVRPRQELPQAAHLSHVLLADEGVDDDSGGEEEQRLEERVRHQVEHRVRVCTQTRGEEHVADLRHRRVGDDALDVDLDERDQPGEQERRCAEAGGKLLDVRRRLEDRSSAHEQVDARSDHRRCVNEGADRSRALHRVREPGLERELRRLRDRAAEQPERDEVDRPGAGLTAGPVERRVERQRARPLDEQEEGERHRRVAERVHDERLLRGGDRARPLVVEADQQVGAEPDEAPADE